MLNLNTKAMLRHGSIGALTFLSIVIIWGTSNALIAFPLALTSLAISKQDITINTGIKAIRLILIYTTIVTLSYTASLNAYLGVFINFISIFSICYIFTINFNPVLYKPFLMLYIFTSFGDTNIQNLFDKISIVIFGVLLVIVSERLIHQKNNKSQLISTAKNSVDLCYEILKSSDDTSKKNFHLKNLTLIRSIFYKIYITRFKKALTTKLGKIELSLSTNLLSLSNTCYKLSLEENVLQLAIKDISNFKNNISSFSSELAPILTKIHNDFNSINKLSKGEEKALLDDLALSEKYGMTNNLKKDFKIGSIRMNFSLRATLLLTPSIFIGAYYNPFKIIWVSITIMSVIAPYYEDTYKRMFDRAKGNIFGIAVVAFIGSIIDDNTIIFLIILCSIYLTFGVTEYKKLSFFTTLASLCSASFYTPVKELAVVRVLYVLLGILLVFLGNKFIFPYTLDKGISSLTSKILNLKNHIALESLIYPPKLNEIVDSTILAFLYIEKLHLRNLQYASDDVYNFIINESRSIDFLLNHMRKELP